MTPEGELKKQVKGYLLKLKLDGHKVYGRWPVPVGYGKQGLDWEGCINGRYVAIETKAPGKLPTPRQNATIKEMVEGGGIAFYADSIERVKRYIEDHVLGQYNPKD